MKTEMNSVLILHVVTRSLAHDADDDDNDDDDDDDDDDCVNRRHRQIRRWRRR